MSARIINHDEKGKKLNRDVIAREAIFNNFLREVGDAKGKRRSDKNQMMQASHLISMSFRSDKGEKVKPRGRFASEVNWSLSGRLCSGIKCFYEESEC